VSKQLFKATGKRGEGKIFIWDFGSGLALRAFPGLRGTRTCHSINLPGAHRFEGEGASLQYPFSVIILYGVFICHGF